MAGVEEPVRLLQLFADARASCPSPQRGDALLECFGTYGVHGR